MSLPPAFMTHPPDFSRPTYIVLDAPPALAEYVTELRARFQPVMAGLPVEITLAGSSGVGCLAADTDAGLLFTRLEALAAQTAPLALRFRHITTFPGSPVHYLSPEPAQGLHALHRQLLSQAGLRFGDSPFPFSPHLTIAWIEQGLPAKSEELLAIRPPSGRFVFAELAVYSQHRTDTRLHFRTALTGI